MKVRAGDISLRIPWGLTAFHELSSHGLFPERLFRADRSGLLHAQGAPLLLSPLDFEKAVEWFAASVPVEVVEEGIADYFTRLASRKVPARSAICLSFAEDLIFKALAARRTAAVGAGRGHS